MKRNPIQINNFVIIISFISSSILFLSLDQLSFAQKEDEDEDKNDEDNDKLIVKAQINLKNIDMENTKFIRVIGFINGEESKKDIPISSIDKNKNILNVDLKVNEENEIVKANTPDEFFVCAYQVGGDDVSKQTTTTIIPKFDCNEGDILGNPTKISLFKPDSQVYSKSQALYQASLNTNSSSNTDKVKIKVYAPLSDKKDTKKLKFGVMIKGQIKSEVIEDVQAELGKDSTIKRTFTFDRNTDIGKIQIEHRYHACVPSEDLAPPEGQECEKRIVKNLEKVSGLYAR